MSTSAVNNLPSRLKETLGGDGALNGGARHHGKTQSHVVSGPF